MGRHSGSGLRLLEALPDDGERRLMLAALMDAIRILRQPGTRPNTASRVWLAEKRWLDSDEHIWPFAFVSICNALGLDPSYVRRCVFDPAGHMPMNGRRYAATTEQVWDGLRRPRRSRSVTPSINAAPVELAAKRACTGINPERDVDVSTFSTASWERSHCDYRAGRDGEPHPCTADAAAFPGTYLTDAAVA